jgi:gamma-glutamyltranspeptidase/glutathione hydrolase
MHEIFPGRLELNDAVPDWVRRDLKGRGYDLRYRSRTSGPINAILLDPVQGTFWGGSSNHGEDYGIAW